jgi:F-type H+-transporting ATPase subunit c
MKKVSLVAFMTLMAASSAFAQDGGVAAGNWAKYLGAAFAIGIAALGTGLGMGNAIKGALEGVSRNPSVAPRIMTMMILGLALIESLAIYSLVVAILLLMVV